MAREEPGARKPGARKPRPGKPRAREPAVREPAVREPAVREPAVREPAVREPAVREPAARESTAPQPGPEDVPRRLVVVAFVLAAVCALLPFAILGAGFAGAVLYQRGRRGVGAGVIAVAVLCTALGVLVRVSGH